MRLALSGNGRELGYRAGRRGSARAAHHRLEPARRAANPAGSRAATCNCIQLTDQVAPVRQGLWVDPPQPLEEVRRLVRPYRRFGPAKFTLASPCLTRQGSVLRRPRGLRGHRPKLAYGLVSVLCIAPLAVLMVVLYRLIFQDWLARILRETLAASIVWGLAAAVMVLTEADVLDDLRGTSPLVAPNRGHRSRA